MRAALLLASLLTLCWLAGAAQAQQPRTVRVTVTEAGYMPNVIPAEPGEHLLLIFENDGTAGCCSAIVVPAAKAGGIAEIEKPLLIEVTAPKKGKMVFNCTMKMCSGEIVVEKKKATAPPAPKPQPAAPPRTPT